MVALYDVLWEQSSKEMLLKLQGEDGFAAMEAVRDPLQLRNRIKRMCCGFGEQKMKVYALAEAIKRVAIFCQRPRMSNEEYKIHFDALRDTAMHLVVALPITRLY